MYIVKGGVGIAGAVYTGANLAVAGNAIITNSLYAAGVYDSGARVVSASTGAGNLRITSNGWIALSETGSAGSYGSGTTVPVITLDNYGRVVSVTTAAIPSASTPNFVETANVSIFSNTNSYTTGVFYPTFSNVAGGNSRIGVNSGLTFNAASGNLIATGIVGTIWGAVAATTANVSGLAVINGNLVAASSTASNSTTTGALVVVGGAGIAGNATIGGCVRISSSTVSTSTSTGALIVTGGLAVGSNVHISGSAGNAIVTSANINASNINVTGGIFLNGTPYASGASFNGGSVSGAINVTNTTESTSSSSGALIVAGGAGIGARLNVAGNIVASATTVSLSTTTGALVVRGGAGVSGNVFVGGNLVVSNTNPSTSTSTGALVVAGGVGVAGAIYATAIYVNGEPVSTNGAATFTKINNTPIGPDTPNTGNFTTLNATSGITGTLSTASQTNITSVGVLTSLSVSGTLSASTVVGSGNIVAASGVDSTSSTTGALVVVGGVGISANVFTGGTLTVTGNTAVNNTLYARGIYDNGARVVSTSTGSGNLRIVSNGWMSLSETGSPGTYGSTTMVPVITVDNYGRVISASNVTITAPTPVYTETAGVSIQSNTNTYSTGTFYPTLSNVAGGNSRISTSSAFTYNTATGNLATTGFVGTFWGAVAATTANVGGNLNVSGNAIVNNKLYAAEIYSGGLPVLTSVTQQPYVETAGVSILSNTNTYSTGTFYPALSNVAGGNSRISASSSFTYNAGTANLTATGFVGTHWGPVAATTANVSANLNVSGNAIVSNKLYASEIYSGGLPVLTAVTQQLYTETAGVSIQSNTNTYSTGTFYPTLSNIAGGNSRISASSAFTYNTATGNLATTGFVGTHWGKVEATTANVSSIFSVGGNTAINNTLYAQGLYDNGTRVVSLSSGNGNLRITSNGWIAMPETGSPGTYGSATRIPTFTIDNYGRISSASNINLTFPGFQETANVSLYSSTAVYSSATNNTISTFYVTFSNIAGGNSQIGTSTAFTWNANTGNVTAPGFVGTHWGPIAATTANISGRFIVSGNTGINNKLYAWEMYSGGQAVLTTSSLSGSIETANVSMYTNTNSFDTGTFYPTFSNVASGNSKIGTDSGFTFNATSGNLNTTGFVGTHWGPLAATTANVSSTLTVSGNTAVNNTIYGLGVYDNGVRVVSASSGAGNLTITGSSISMSALGAAGTYGTSTSFPRITIDAYGRITNVTTSTAIISIVSSDPGNVSVTGTASAKTIKLPAHGPGADTYGNTTSYPIFTVDDYGRISANSFQTTVNDINSTGLGNVLIGGSASVPTINLRTHGPGAGSYGGSSQIPVLTVDNYGRISGISLQNVVASSTTNLSGGAAGTIAYQTATNTTGFSAAGTAAGWLLQSGTNGTGQPSWIDPTTISVNYATSAGSASTASTATRATDLSAGSANAIVYQDSVNNTAFLAAGTSGYVLRTNGTGAAPSWMAQSSIKAGDLNGGTAMSLPYQSAASTTVFLAAGTAGQVLTTNGTASAPTWSDQTDITAGNIAAGTAMSIVYQNAAGQTKFLAAGTAGYVLKTNGTGSAPSWTAMTAGGLGSAVTRPTRSLSVTYTNSTGRTILVTATVTHANTTNAVLLTVTAYVDGVIMAINTLNKYATAATLNAFSTITFAVPSGSTYQIVPQTTVMTLFEWVEI